MNQSNIFMPGDRVPRLDRSGRRTAFRPEERRLADRVASEHGLTATAMLSRSRSASVALARHHFIAVLRWSTFMSYPEIGALLGGLDHSTIMSAEKRYDRLLNGDVPPVHAWRRPHGMKTPTRLWGCSKHPDSDVAVSSRASGPRVRFCHAYDARTGRECGELLAPKAEAPEASPS